MKRETMNRRRMIGGAAALTGAAAIAARGVWAQDATPIPGGTPTHEPAQATPDVARPLPPQWPLYGHDVSGARFTWSSAISAGVAHLLDLAWTAPVGGAISGTPVIAGGLVVIGAYDGIVRAFDAESGGEVWSYDTGAAVPEPNLQIPIGVTGSAAIVDNVVYIGDATGALHAIHASSGGALWTSRPSDQPAASIWSSPIVTEGVLYTGVASVAKEEGFRGVVVAVDAATGATIWEHYVTPEGTDGGGVFGVPAIDLDRRLLVVGTQNAYSADVAATGNVMSVIALDLASGALVWAFSGLPEDGSATVADDIAFSASPNLFTATIDGVERELVGIGQKSGRFWALDRDTGEPVWSTEISAPGPLGGMEGTSAAGNGVIVVPATEWPDFSDPAATGVVRGLDAATGTIIWSQSTGAPNPAPAAISHDVAFVAGFDGVLRAYGLYDGTVVWSFDLGASVSGGIAIAGDLVVLGAATPVFAPFIREGSQVWAFRLTSPPIVPATPDPTETPTPATPEPETPEPEPTEPPGSPQASPSA